MADEDQKIFDILDEMTPYHDFDANLKTCKHCGCIIVDKEEYCPVKTVRQVMES